MIGNAALPHEDLHAVRTGGGHIDRGRGRAIAPEVGRTGGGGIERYGSTGADRGVRSDVHRGGREHGDGDRIGGHATVQVHLHGVGAGGVRCDRGRGRTRAPGVGGSRPGGIEGDVLTGAQCHVVTKVHHGHGVHGDIDDITHGACTLGHGHAIGSGCVHGDRCSRSSGAPCIAGARKGSVEHGTFALAQREVRSKVHGIGCRVGHGGGIGHGTTRRVRHGDRIVPCGRDGDRRCGGARAPEMTESCTARIKDRGLART